MVLVPETWRVLSKMPAPLAPVLAPSVEVGACACVTTPEQSTSSNHCPKSISNCRANSACRMSHGRTAGVFVDPTALNGDENIDVTACVGTLLGDGDERLNRSLSESEVHSRTEAEPLLDMASAECWGLVDPIGVTGRTLYKESLMGVCVWEFDGGPWGKPRGP